MALQCGSGAGRTNGPIEQICAAGLWVLLASGCAPGVDTGPFTPAGRTAAATITTERLTTHIRVLSADEFEGRGPASNGDRRTRRYLADQLETMGYRPAADDGTWEQAFDIVSITATVPETWTFTTDAASRGFARWDDFVAASGVQDVAATIDDAEVVFVGYGIEAPEYDWNDFKGRDVQGKVLLMLNNDPDWDPALFEGDRRLYYGRWDYKYESAARHGAAGVIIIHTPPSAGYPWQVVQNGWTGEQFALPDVGGPRIQVEAWMTEDAAAELVALAGLDLGDLVAAARSRAFVPVPLGVTTSLRLRNEMSTVSTANVLGILPGADPELKDEVVVYTAHHDHIGIGEPDDTGDRIYNGARDNASGVAQVLEIAGAFRSMPTPPRRSILILFVAAEEQGLLGSQFYADNPTFPPGRIAANVNIDGGNVWGRARDIQDIAFGKSSLDGVAQRVAERQGRITTPDQFPDKGYYYRSDQFNFAKIGVPAMYFKEGIDFVDRPSSWGRAQIDEYYAVRYHQPSDEMTDDWNLDGMAEDAQLAFWAGLLTANADEMPTWTPGNEFEAARQAAIELLTQQPSEN